jgi:hypothetical protein
VLCQPLPASPSPPSLPPSLSPLLHEMFETPITFIQIHVLHAQSSEVRRTPRASLSLCASPVEHQFLISVTAHSFCADLPANNNSIPPTLPPSTAMGPRPTPHSPCFAACQLGSRVAVSPPCACPLPVGASFLATPPVSQTFTNICSLKPCFEIPIIPPSSLLRSSRFRTP